MATDRFSMTACKRFLGHGLTLPWLLLLASCAKPEGRRSEIIDIALALIIVLFPIISFILRKRGDRVLYTLTLVHFVLYLVYESGIPVYMNIRIDLVLIYPVLLINGFFVLWYTRDRDDK